MNSTKRRQQGFTIVELLIVIVVIGILAAITIVAYNGIQRRAMAAAQQADLRSLGQRAQLLATYNDTSFRNVSLWKQALIDARLFEATESSDGGFTADKSMLVCANDEQYIIGAWQPYNTTEASATDVNYAFNGSVSSINWDHSVVGDTTLQKFCQQVSDKHGVNLYQTGSTLRIWMHNALIRDASPLP